MRGTMSFGPSPKSVPVTMGLIITLVIAFLVAWASPNPILEPLIFQGDWSKFWTAFTYPWGSFGVEVIIFFLMGLLWLYSIGGDVEREVGPRFYAALFFVMTLLGAIGVTIGGAVMNTKGMAMGDLIPACGITCVWASRRPNTMASFFGIPIAAKWIGGLAVLMVLIPYGKSAPLMGLFAALPCLVGWLFGSGKLPIRFPNQWGSSTSTAHGKTKAERAKEQREFEGFIDNVRAREQERAEKERLRKLFESSLDDDGGEKKSGS